MTSCDNTNPLIISLKHYAKQGDPIAQNELGSCYYKGNYVEKDYYEGKVPLMSMDEYVKLVRKCIEALPPGTVIHRMTGDGSKKDLVGPLWSADKKTVLNALRKELEN